MDFELSDEQRLLRDTVRDFARNEVGPRAAELDATKSFPYELVGMLGDVFQQSAYDSLFITITGFHGAHVAGGLLMNLYVQLRAWLGHFDAERHDAVSNAVLYWHFVDGVWLFILASLYLSPRLF